MGIKGQTDIAHTLLLIHGLCGMGIIGSYRLGLLQRDSVG